MSFGVRVNSAGNGVPDQDVSITPPPEPLTTFLYEGNAATSPAVDGRVVGDTAARVVVQADGKIKLGDGTDAADVTLYRSAPDVLRTDGAFVAAAGVTCLGSATTSDAVTVQVADDAQARLVVNADGSIEFGAGDTTRDVTVSRTAANILATGTGDKFVATGGLGVGNRAAATTPGSVTGKFEVFAADGTSIGYVALYDAIS